MSLGDQRHLHVANVCAGRPRQDQIVQGAEKVIAVIVTKIGRGIDSTCGRSIMRCRVDECARGVRWSVNAVGTDAAEYHVRARGERLLPDV